MYLLNHNTKVINEIEFDNARKDRNPDSGDKLYRNDGGKFVDVSQEAGIMGNSMGFGLGWLFRSYRKRISNIYISNDYIEPDYFYINWRRNLLQPDGLPAAYFLFFDGF